MGFDTIVVKLIVTTLLAAIVLFLGRAAFNLLFNPIIAEAQHEGSNRLTDSVGEAVGWVTNRNGLLVILSIVSIWCAWQAFSPASPAFWSMFEYDKFNIPAAGQVAWRWSFFFSLGILYLVAKYYKPATH